MKSVTVNSKPKDTRLYAPPPVPNEKTLKFLGQVKVVPCHAMASVVKLTFILNSVIILLATLQTRNTVYVLIEAHCTSSRAWVRVY